MPFRIVGHACREFRHASFDESLMHLAAQTGPVACLWQAGQCLVVPRTYRRYPAFPQTCARFARRGWPVVVRLSGGGLVPQGPGIVNLSMAYAMQGVPLNHSDAAYRSICAIIAGTLAGFGITAQPQAVEGSFCDGRYNLACGTGAAARKVAGTAQVWRRMRPAGRDTAPVQVVLVHAMVMAAVDTAAITSVANRFESALGSGRRYDGGRIASLYDVLGETGRGREAFIEDLLNGLARRAAASEPAAAPPSSVEAWA